MEVLGEGCMNVSVVIPARNAAETLGEALASLRAQTLPDWEAIVVDDGSHDGTATIAVTFAARDARILHVSQPQMGVSAARNTGISLARFDWLLFLDADDWLSPLHLERMTAALVSDPDLDAVHCGWARVTPDGQIVDKAYRKAGDLFALLARGPAFVIHACIVRRSLVEAIGGFDTSLRTCEDWDLWQRIARTGARIGAIDDVLALYRMRPSSASLAGRQMLVDGLRVISRGFSSDGRVPQPKPEYANGLPPEDLASTKALFACWCAGLVLGRGEDARPLLDALRDDHCPALDPSYVADSIFNAAVLPRCRPLTAWEQLRPGLEQRLDEFLLALEARSMAPGLARRARTILERLTLVHSTARRPLTVGAMHAVRVEVTEPIPDILPPVPAERLHCAAELEGEGLGTLELPVCDGAVPGHVLADAIAAEFAGPILGRFFERTIYRGLRLEKGPNGMSVRRGALCLAAGLPDDARAFRSQVHDRVGWVVFLQEIWARPEWPDARFYDPQAVEDGAARRRVDDGWLVVEVSEDPPDVEVACQALDVVLRVGGTALGVVPVPVKRKTVRAQELRAALTMASGFELCRAVVREGLLGRPLTGHLSLRARLAAAAVAQSGGDAPAPDASAITAFAPGSARALSRSLAADERGLVLGRRSHAAMGTSAYRRAVLPAAAARELVEAASAAGEPVIEVPKPGGRPERVVYAPDLIRRPIRGARASALRENGLGPRRPTDAAVYGRHHFEALFAARPDPWGYTSPYEQTKYEQTLALLPSSQITRALDLACAEGHFTAQLAPRVRSLIAADISEIALDQAVKRCAGLDNVRFARLDLTRDLLPGRFELIVCSEVLYYVADRRRCGPSRASWPTPSSRAATLSRRTRTLSPTNRIEPASTGTSHSARKSSARRSPAPALCGSSKSSGRPSTAFNSSSAVVAQSRPCAAAPRRSSSWRSPRRYRPMLQRTFCGTAVVAGAAALLRLSSPTGSRSSCITALRRRVHPRWPATG